MTAVNDAPVNVVPGDQSTAQDTPLNSPREWHPISATDADIADDQEVEVTLSVTNGTLTLGELGGPVGGETAVNTTTAGSQRSPIIAYQPDGSSIVVWTDPSADGDSTGVFAQRFDADGTAIGSEFQVNTYTTSFQTVAFRVGRRFG